MIPVLLNLPCCSAAGRLVRGFNSAPIRAFLGILDGVPVKILLLIPCPQAGRSRRVGPAGLASMACSQMQLCVGEEIAC